MIYTVLCQQFDRHGDPVLPNLPQRQPWTASGFGDRDRPW